MMANRPNRRRAAVIASVAVVLALVFGWWGLAVYHDNHYRARQLRLDMRQADVERVFGRPADCATRVGQATVLIFIDPAWDDGQRCLGIAASYSTPAQLPWIYSSVQVALDRNGHVSAFVHVGESVAQTRVAQKPGGTLGPVPVEALE